MIPEIEEQNTSFRIAGLDPEPFLPLFALSAAELATRRIERVVADAKPGVPCRISLDDADLGEPVLLLSHEHQKADTPYRQQGPIFVRKTRERFEDVNRVPPALARRLLSLRAFDEAGAMIEAEVVDGGELADMIDRFLADPKAAYLHAHTARRGCFLATVERARPRA